MKIGGTIYRLSVRRSLANTVRRRAWNRMFADSQRRMGGFFCDVSDHIGRERIITGDDYEAEHLHALQEIIESCRLGMGMAIDVGANIGNHSCWFTKLFKHVICVEPGDIAALILRANLLSSKRSNWDIFIGALGDRSGSGILDVVNSENLGSSQVLLAEKDKGDFPILTGDELLSKCGVSDLPLELLKVDVEGFELAVLKGCSNSIVKWRPVICVEALRNDLWLKIRGFLKDMGYQGFMVLKADNADGFLARTRTTFQGRNWRLIEIPFEFPENGYPMVFCFTQRHLEMLGA